LKFARRKSRRAVASIVATVIMFAILFTVGTSYFIFVSSENAAYVQNLLGATNKVQGSLAESLSIGTLLDANGSVEFNANNTSSETVNVTAVLVISSTGALISCQGVGFPAGAGCTNTTPTLWKIVNPGSGSPNIDTEYHYNGTTLTLKVLTARGNSYSATYPEPPSQSTSSQSVTVSLDNLKWVQLIPQASSLVQKNFVANCNSASCAAAYASSVTAGNILVDAVSWPNQAPPASVPTDTRGDAFTLGASASVVVPSSPSVVQHKYNSNCNAASCGLAFTSSVTLGNTLVFSLGWANQSPPSSPTDTRGDTFTLGSSKSLTVNPPSPAVVQHRYLANCNSATCALAYSSSVTAGNTLVFGLGWPTTQLYSYVPVTITNSQGSATPTSFQQLVTWNPSTYSTYEASDLGNVRLCADTACNTPLHAWLESCTSSCAPSATSASAWVKLTSSIAGSGGSLKIYMVFEGTSVEFDTNYWGEAPNISATYAQYDNGASVFAAYFNGNTATSSFSVFSGYTLAKATGISGPGGATINAIKATGYNGNNPVFSFNAAMGNAAVVTESSFSSPGSVSPGTDTGVVGLVNNAAAASVNNAVSANVGYSAVYFNQDYVSGGAMTTDVNPQGSATSNWVYATLTYTGPGSSSWSAFIAPQLYSTTGGYSGTVSNNPMSSATNLYLGQVSSTSSTFALTVYYNFDRARAYPPSGVMPSTSSGSLAVGTASPTSVSDTLGDSFTLGASQSALSGSTTFESSIWYSTAASSGSDTITATFGAVVPGSAAVYELAGYSTSGVQASSGSSSAGSTAASVGSFTPTSNSFVVGNVETGSSATKYTVGAGYTTVASGAGGCDASDASQGCNEYETGLGSATTTPFTLSASRPWVDVALSFAPLAINTYYSYIWYATAASSGADTISASFGSTVAGSVSTYEVSGVTAAGLLTSTGSSASSQAATSVASITPGAGSVVVGNAETTSTTYTAGAGYTLSGSCSPVPGCGEYQTGVGSATTVPISISPSSPWVEAAVAFAPIMTSYYSYIWYATAGTSGADTVTAAFGASVTASVSLYEITGYTTSGVLSSTGSSSTSSTSATVASYTPAANSFIVGAAESPSSVHYTAGAGFTAVSTCNPVFGCSEYSVGGGGSPNTVPITLGTSAPWVEAAMSFSTPFNPQSGIQVGGYPTMGVSSGASLAWEVTFTNVDPQHRPITIWPQTEMAIGSAEYDGFDTDYTQAHYYIIDSLNIGSTTVNGYTKATGNFIMLAYNVPTTLFFAATAALGSTTQAFGTNVLTPFEAYFALTGIFSDGALFGETIPYPYGIITQASAYTTPTAGATAATVTVSCTSPCHFTASASAMVGWINSAGQLTQLATFTMSSSGNIPAGVTFQVPTAAAGYYTIEVTDYINSVFSTFQHT